MPKQILLVDDSITIQRVVELTFAHEDYKIVGAKSVEDGLAKAQSSKPDIVLADANLPGQSKSGYDLCAALRADGALASVPCLILTGNFSPYDEGRGQKAGADGYVVKPFETQALIDKVNDAINRKAARSSSGSQPVVTALPTAPTMIGAAPTLPSTPPAPAAPPTVPMTRKDDSLEISIEGNVPKAAPPPPPPAVAAAPPPPPSAANRPSSIPAPLAPPPKPPTNPPANARTIMGMPAPPLTPPPPKAPMTPETLGKPLSLVAQETAPQAAPPPPPRPPSLAPEMPGATPSKPLRDTNSIPHAAPQMPRSPLIPNVPTPMPTGNSAVAPLPGGPKTMPPRATLMGIPAVNPANLPPGAIALPTPGQKPNAPWAPPSAPGAPMSPPRPESIASAVADRAVGEIAARGAEYEAIAKLSREVIERIAWEVVPELAETIIREQLDRLVAERQK
jgi:CheY-like chemotaxis protein